MTELTWQTAITKVEPNKISVRGYRIDDMMGKLSFAQSIYLILKGELPSEKVGKMIDAILVSSIDHGASPPSTLAAITAASTGSAMNGALACGILAINKFHGGAIEGCMNVLKNIAEIKNERSLSIEEAVESILINLRNQKKRAPGFGHRLHTKDPRSIKLFKLAHEYEIAGEYVNIAKTIEVYLKKTSNRSLPINVDGAIATVLCELDFQPALGNVFFIMARIPGLVAHVVEEQSRQKPMRKIHPTAYEYDGQSERTII